MKVNPISNSTNNLLQTIWRNIHQKDFHTAITNCKTLNTSFPENAEGWYATSLLALQLGDPRQALKSIDNALSIDSTIALWIVHKAGILNVLGEWELSQKLIVQLTKIELGDTKTCAEFAMLLSRTKDYAGAEVYYKKAIDFSPDESQLYFNLASIQRYLGQVSDSEKNLNTAISLAPEDSEAYLLRSNLRKQTKESNHVLELQKAISKKNKQSISLAQLHYALAKELEDLGSYQKSFQELSTGAHYQRSSIKYDPKTDINIIQKIMETYDGTLLNNKQSGSNDDRAIFILGLPRTGSTLVDRIICSHDKVQSAGELNDFAIEMMKQCKVLAQGLPKSRTQIVELTRKIDFSALGRDYINSAYPKTATQSKFIDKLPLNSLNVGLIHLALPRAKIIHVARHPMDTCYSMYKHLFNNGYPFSYDLTELANYYIVHHQLMQHWKKILPGVIHTVKYEDLVNNLESEAKKMIAYCDLDWQQQCVQYHLNKSPAVTASATQVRTSAYTSSINKWTNYQEELKDLRTRLESAGICCD